VNSKAVKTALEFNRLKTIIYQKGFQFGLVINPDDKIPELIIGTLSALNIKGGNVSLYGDENGIGWRLSFPISKDSR